MINRGFAPMVYQKVFFFTPKIDLSDPIFGHSLDWIRAISGKVNSLEVIAVHLENAPRNFGNNVHFSELGGGSFSKRIKGFFKLIHFGFVASFGERNQTVVIYHMLKEPGVIIGALLKLAKVHQILWYSHSANSIALKLTNCLVDQVFTPTINSYPIQSKKLRIIGHGIDSEKFNVLNAPKENQRDGIISVGRISRIKKLESLIFAMANINEDVNFIGPIFDEEYSKSLLNMSHEFQVNLKLSGPKSYEQIQSIFLNSEMCYTGSPKTLDKSAVQAAMCGCFVVSNEISVLDAVGMTQIWQNLGFKCPPELNVQIRELLKISQSERVQLRNVLAEISTKRHGLERLTEELLSSS
jgi:glycosyltransferase involved in cell wall biosynthesis